MRKILLVISLIAVKSLFSQDYQWQSNVDSVRVEGFYKVDLKPSIVAKLQPSFSDVRIKDEENKEVPYFIKKEVFSATKRVFKEYKIIKKLKWKNGATVLVVENKDQKKINNLQLQIKNFDVRKRLELAGSDDNKDWFTIKEDYFFYSADGQNKTSEVKSLNFNYTDYKYYRIIIYDVFSLPINVLKIGYYDTYQEEGKYKKLKTPELSRFDSLQTKQTYVKVQFSETPYSDKLVFKIDKPTHFYRNASICIQKQDKKGRYYYQRIKSLILNSNKELVVYQSDFQNPKFYLVIENEDNPPLENISVEAYQLNRYLITHLNGGNKYRLVFGDDKVRPQPNYDINHFKDKIGEVTTVLRTGEISSIQYHHKKKIRPSAWWIWLTIGFVVILLGYVSYRMVNEMEK